MEKKYKIIAISLFIIVPILAIINRYLPEEYKVNFPIIFLLILPAWIVLRGQAKQMDKRRHQKEQEENERNSKSEKQ